jgi:hypothetical protein
VRLTLRTLLAYLDDTLDPAEIKRIGQKVAESETARELIARIKSVTRRRRLTTPPLTGSADKFDPNTVAEYLDNSLPPEQVEEIEKICLESDVHLAEIGTCHQILTLVLGEPALVPPSAKRRMYALGGGKRSSGIRKTAPAAASAGSTRDHDESGDDALLLGLPALRHGNTWLRWLLPIAGCLLLAALAVVIIMAFPKGEDSQRRRAKSDGLIAAVNPDKTKPPKGNGDVGQPESNKDGKRNGESNKDGKTNGELNKDGKPDKPNTDVSPQPVPKPGPASTKAPAWSAAPPSSKRQPLGKLVRNDAWNDLVMQSQGDAGPYRRLVANGRFNSTDTLVSLPGYRSELACDSGLGLVLWGNVGQQLEGPILESGITPHAAEPDKDGGLSDLDCTLSRGRIWITNKKKDDQPAYVRLRFLKEIWDLTLDPGTEIGVELVGREIGLKPTQAEEEPGAVLWLVVKKGKLAARDDLREFPPMVAPASLLWTSGRGAPGPETMPQWPPYWEQPVQIRKGAPGGPEMDRALTTLRNYLTDPNRSAGEMLAEALKTSEDPAVQLLTTLSFGAVDAVEDLADYLGHERYPIVRDGAIEALRHWLGRGPGQRDRFRKVLSGKFDKTEVDAILYFLRLPSADDLRDRDTFVTAIDDLASDKLAIRHLAFWHLQRMASKEMRENKLFFDPAGPPEVRDQMQKKWRKALDDGKMPPDQSRGPPGGGGPGKQ